MKTHEPNQYHFYIMYDDSRGWVYSFSVTGLVPADQLLEPVLKQQFVEEFIALNLERLNAHRKQAREFPLVVEWEEGEPEAEVVVGFLERPLRRERERMPVPEGVPYYVKEQ